MKRNIVKVLLAALVAAVAVPYGAFAQTASSPSGGSGDIAAQIQALMAEVQALEIQAGVTSTVATTGGTTWCHTFTQNLGLGMSGPEVTALQIALQLNGEPATVNGTYDAQTAAAVSAFQEKYAAQVLAPLGLTMGTGFAGVATRGELDALYGNCLAMSTVPTSTATSSTAGMGNSNVLLNISENMSMGSASVTPGSSNQRIASFTVTNVSASPITLDASNGIQINPGANSNVYLAMRVYVNGALYGSQSGLSNGTAYPITGSSSITIAPNQSVTVDVYADVSATAPLGTSNTASIYLSVPNATSSSTVPGQTITISSSASNSNSSTTAATGSITLNSLNPASGSTGASVTITGGGFPATSTILFNNLIAIPVANAISSTTISFIVPMSLQPNCGTATTTAACGNQPATLLAPGNYQVTVTENGQTSNSLQLQVTSNPYYHQY